MNQSVLNLYLFNFVKASTGDPIVDKYVASGLRREAVSLAVLNYGDNPVKVRRQSPWKTSLSLSKRVN